MYAESKAVKNCERLRILQTIFNQPPVYYVLDSSNIAKDRSIKSTKEQILNGSWK